MVTNYISKYLTQILLTIISVCLFKLMQLMHGASLGTFIIDNVSYPFLLLNLFLFILCILLVRNEELNPTKYMFTIFLLHLITSVFFITDNMLIFYICFELSLLPMFYIMNTWGTDKNKYKYSIKMVTYTVFGSLFMLLSIAKIYVYFNTFSIRELVEVLSYSSNNTEKLLIFIGFLAAFIIKIPLFPTHYWLPNAHASSPTIVSVLLSGLMLKFPIYGLLRIIEPMQIDSDLIHSFLIAASFTNIFYCSILAYRQQDIKKIIAYSSIVHMGYIVLGISSGNLHGKLGAVVQMVAHGITSPLLFICAHIVKERFHTRNIDEMDHLAKHAPNMYMVFLISVLISISIPGSLNFIGESMVIVGLIKKSLYMAFLAIMGIFLQILYSMRMVNGIFFQKKVNHALLSNDSGVTYQPTGSVSGNIKDLTVYEGVIVLIPIMSLVFLGFKPSLILNKIM